MSELEVGQKVVVGGETGVIRDKKPHYQVDFDDGFGWFDRIDIQTLEEFGLNKDWKYEPGDMIIRKHKIHTALVYNIADCDYMKELYYIESPFCEKANAWDKDKLEKLTKKYIPFDFNVGDLLETKPSAMPMEVKVVDIDYTGEIYRIKGIETGKIFHRQRRWVEEYFVLKLPF